MILGFLDVALIDKAERKVEAGRHNVVVACLTEDVAYLGDKLRQTCRLRIAYLDIEIAHRHQAAKCVLCYLAPHALVFFLIFQDGEFKIFVHLGENLHTVFVYHARLHCKRLTIGGLGTHFHLLGLHIVLDDGGGVLLQRNSAYKALRLLLGIYIALVVGEAVVDVLEIFALVVECEQVESTIDGECRLVGNGVTRRHIAKHRASLPIIG